MKLLATSSRRLAQNATRPGATLEVSEVASQPIDDLLKALNTNESGLSAANAAALLHAVGPNEIESAKRKSLAFDFFERFANPLVLILIFAAAVSAFTGDMASFAIISAIVLVSVVLDLSQEHQAQKAAEQLRAQVSLTATVARGSVLFRSPARSWARWRLLPPHI